MIWSKFVHKLIIDKEVVVIQNEKYTCPRFKKNKSIRFSKKVVAKREVSHFSLFAPVVNKSHAVLCLYAR